MGQRLARMGLVVMFALGAVGSFAACDREDVKDAKEDVRDATNDDKDD